MNNVLTMCYNSLPNKLCSRVIFEVVISKELYKNKLRRNTTILIAYILSKHLEHINQSTWIVFSHYFRTWIMSWLCVIIAYQINYVLESFLKLWYQKNYIRISLEETLVIIKNNVWKSRLVIYTLSKWSMLPDFRTCNSIIFLQITIYKFSL